MKKKSLILLVLMIALVLVSAVCVNAADDEKTNIYVRSFDLSGGGYLYNGGTEVKDSAPADSTGYVHYDVEKRVLTLHNAKLSDDDKYMPPVYSTYKLEVVLEGTNTIKSTSKAQYGINVSYGELVISGDGTLNIDSYVDTPVPEGYNYSSSCIAYGIQAYESITINGGTINISSYSEYGEAYGLTSWSGSITINNANVKIDADGNTDSDAVKASEGFFVPGGHSLTNEKYFTDADQTEWETSDFSDCNCLKVVSGKLTDVSKFGVWINGVKLTSSNPYWKNGDSEKCTGTSKSYNAYYDRDKRQLTLNNAVINKVYHDTFDDCLIYVNGDITVNVKGSNKFAYITEEQTIHGLMSSGSMTVSGNGSISMSLSTSGFLDNVIGIYAYDTLTINNVNIDLDVTAEQYANCIAADYLVINKSKMNLKASSASGESCEGLCGYDDVKITGADITIALESASVNPIYSNEEISISGGHSINDGSALFEKGRAVWRNNCFDSFGTMTIKNGVITNAQQYKLASKQVFVNGICIYNASDDSSEVNYWKNGDTTACTGTSSDYNAYYDAGSRTLYLKDAEITECPGLTPETVYYCMGDSAGIFSDGDIIINLTGSNSIVNSNTEEYSSAYGVYAFKTVTFNGNGKLAIEIKKAEYAYAVNAQYGINVEGNATVSVKLNEKVADGFSAFCTSFGQGISAAEAINDKSFDFDYNYMTFVSKVTTQIDPADLSKPAILKGSVTPFNDVKKADYFCDAVKWAVENGVTNGKTETVFAPYASCTRAEFITFLWRAAGEPVVNYIMPFTDVPEDLYYTEAVRWAASEGIVKGDTATLFKPYGIISRQEAVTFIYRYAKAPAFANMTADGPAPSPFSDVSNTAYSYNAILWAYANEITNGTSATTFGPLDNCERAHVVVFLYNYFGK